MISTSLIHFFRMNNSQDDITACDYMVIGGGTSGAVAARRLAGGKNQYNVCLIEAGPRCVLESNVVLFE
jgi:ribulose 1,5-bisphosphate synthetase/thiazole synthase